MKTCQKWFEEESQSEAAKIDGPVARILIFSVKEDKNEYALLKSLTVFVIIMMTNVVSHPVVVVNIRNRTNLNPELGY